MSQLPVPLDGDVNRAAVLTVPAILTMVIGIGLTAIRVYLRVTVFKSLRWDDFWCVLGLIFLIVTVGLCVYGAEHGVGRHIYFLIKSGEMEQVTTSLLYMRIAEFMVIFSTTWTKFSITIFIFRIFTRKRLKQVTWALIVLNTIVSTLDAAIIFPSCTPVEKVWNQPLPGTCWSPDVINGIGIFQGVVTAFADFYLATLPIIQLWNVQIKINIKVGICALMAMGYATGGFAIVRTILVPSLFTDDITWALPNLFLFGILEASVGIIACTAPTVRGLFHKPSKYNSKPTYDRYNLSTVRGSTHIANPAWGPGGQYSQTPGGYESLCYEGASDSNTEPKTAARDGILLTTSVGVRSESYHPAHGPAFLASGGDRSSGEYAKAV